MDKASGSGRSASAAGMLGTAETYRCGTDRQALPQPLRMKVWSGLDAEGPGFFCFVLFYSVLTLWVSEPTQEGVN